MTEKDYIEIEPGFLDSTIWAEPGPTAIVWITMRFLADEGGIVHSSIPGLANRANVSIAECEAAIAFLSSADDYNPKRENLGRRIKTTPEGWVLLEHFKSEEAVKEERKRKLNAERQRRFRARNQGKAK
jgi:hypothetical protein